MRKYNFDHNGFNFIRINKKRARAAYNNGLTVIFCPCNLRPFGFYNLGLPMEQNKINQNCDGVTFDKLVNEYEFYNCHPDTGKYTAFYIPVETVDRFTGEPSTGADAIEQYNYKFMEV